MLLFILLFWPLAPAAVKAAQANNATIASVARLIFFIASFESLLEISSIKFSHFTAVICGPSRRLIPSEGLFIPGTYDSEVKLWAEPGIKSPAIGIYPMVGKSGG